jgi:hypothetical protein
MNYVFLFSLVLFSLAQNFVFVLHFLKSTKYNKLIKDE